MKVIYWDGVPSMENPHKVDARKLYDSEKVQVVVITLAPGQKLLRHITPVDVLFYVLEGEGIVEVGEERVLVKKGGLVESPANIVHCWENPSPSEELKVLIIKVPRPTSPTKIL